MPLFLVERYVPDVDEQVLELLGHRLRQIAGSRWIGSLALPADDVSLCIFNADTLAEAEEFNHRAAARYEAIVPIIATPRSRFR